MHTQMVFEISPSSVYDLAPYFDSLVADVENNLKYSPEDQAEYKKAPEKFLFDILCDFGLMPEDIDDALLVIEYVTLSDETKLEAYTQYLKVVARNYVKNWTTTFNFDVFCE